MKRSHGLGPLFLLAAVLLIPLQPTLAAVRPAAVSSNVARAQQLAADVREFASAPGLSRAKREKRIATAVRTAVVAATAYRQDPSAVLGAASELAAAATHAAPAYADVIIKAAALAPGVSRIDGAASAIRSAALSGAKGKPVRAAQGTGKKKTAAKPVVRAAAPEPEPEYEPADHAVEMTAESGVGAAVYPEEEMPEPNLPGRRRSVDAPAFAVSATLDVGARYDDNVYLTPTAEVNDTIISAKPGLSMRWGDKSQTHGSLSYAESFDTYLDDTSPNVALGNGDFLFAFDTGVSAGSANASYRQLYQTNTDLAAAGVVQLIHTDLISAGLNLQVKPWAKIGAELGVNYADTNYKFPGLIGNSQIGVPFNTLFSVTPKTDLSLGYTFGTQRPEGGGDSSKDHYLNAGARGQFTAKLSGSFNVGYQTRRVGDNPDDHMLAFNGRFDYELTPRTALNLGMSRNFNASSAGASTKNTSFQLGLKTEFSPQFQMSAAVVYYDNDYGSGVFRPDQIEPAARTDHLWEGNLTASYLFTDWFSTSAAYYLRNNNSTLPDVEFNSNVLSLSLGLKY